MSSTPIYTGFWHDYTQAGAYGWTLTLSVRWSPLLLSALTTFVAIVGGSFWSLIAFTIHQLRAKTGDEDGVYLQQQVVCRNANSAWSVIFELFRICGAWKARRKRRAAPRRLVQRTFYAVIPPLVVIAGFIAAGIFVGDLTRPTYEGNNVKIRPTNCGIVVFNNTESQSVLQAVLLKYVNDTLAARAYARNCYGTTSTPGACSQYPEQSLPYTQTDVACPFGMDSTGKSLCSVDSAYHLDSGLLDTGDYLGINTAKSNRLLFRRSSTCSPINITTYAQQNNSTDAAGFVIYTYFLGPVDGVSNFTYQYNTHIADDSVTYQVIPFTSVSGWTPISPLQVAHADTGLYLLASNAIEYLNTVTDPWFSATKGLSLSGVGLDNQFYKPDQFVSGLACVDQYQICNPAASSQSCTALGSIEDMLSQYLQIVTNPYQNATALRLLGALSQSSTPNIVQYLANSPLFAQEHVTDLISTSLPSNQWQLEVQGWFETSLAKIQAFIASYPTQPTDLAPYGRVVTPNVTLDPIDKAAYDLCSNQRIRNTGSYQSFSGLGLTIIIALGLTIIILSLSVETCVAWWRRRRRARFERLSDAHDLKAREFDDHREIARIADRTLQLQRMALMGANPDARWEGRLEPVPYAMNPEMRFALLVRVDGEDFRYGPVAVVDEDEEIKEDRSTEDGQQDGTSVPLMVPIDEEGEEEQDQNVIEAQSRVSHENPPKKSSDTAISAEEDEDGPEGREHSEQGGIADV